MTFPNDVDLVPSIDANRTLGQEQHTRLHLDTFKLVERIQSFIGPVPAGGEPNIPSATATVRERLVDLESKIGNPPPNLKFAVNPLSANSAPNVAWNAATSTLTLGIPAGIPGSQGPAGSPGTYIRFNSLAEHTYPPGLTKVSVSLPAGSFNALPRVLVSPVQKGTGVDEIPLSLGVRSVTTVGFEVIVHNPNDTNVRAEVTWAAL